MESNGHDGSQMTSPPGQKRIMLWTVPRSLSTAMCRVMLNSGLPSEVMCEPYGLSYFLGPERTCPYYSQYEANPDFSYSNIKAKQEEPFEDKELVFVKNQAYHLFADRLTSDWIPDGYTHTFLIRHPRDVITSKLHILSQIPDVTFDPSTLGYREQIEVAQLLKDLGHRIIVMDATDLMNDPEGMLRAFCREVSLEFRDSMVHWEPLSDHDFYRVFDPEHTWEPCWFRNVRTSSGLTRKPKGNKHRANDVILDDETRDVVERSIEENMKYYEELYSLRITA